MSETDAEQQVATLVQRFYERALADDALRPVFQQAISDWDTHHRVVGDFWSKTLLGTQRYQGHPYVVHARLPLTNEHFARWLALFRATAEEVLSADLAAQAIARAEHMAESFQAGILSNPRYEGPTLWKSAL